MGSVSEELATPEDAILAQLASIVNSKAYRTRAPSRSLSMSSVLTLDALEIDPSDALNEESRMNAGVGKVAAIAHTFDPTFDPNLDLLKVSTLGEGYFAVVELCRTYKPQAFPTDSEAYRSGLLAVKRLKPECIAEEPLEFDNFLAEAALLKTLAHKNVLACYGCVEYTDKVSGLPSAVILLEYLKGGTLRERIDRKDYNSTQANRWLLEIAEGMGYLHSVANLGVAHRDLKPDNILLDEHGVAKIADMGMARIALRSVGGGVAKIALEPPSPGQHASEGADDASLSLTGCTGTPRYMAPENWSGESYTYKVDVFSYAILAFEVLSTQRAYGEVMKSRRMDGQMLADAVAKDGLRPVIPASWPSEIVALLRASWSADPEERPDFSSIILALRDLQARAEQDPTVLECFASPPPARVGERRNTFDDAL